MTQPSEAERVEAPVETPALSNPDALFTRKKLPIRPHTFTDPSGEKITVLLQGLPYIEKREVDMLAQQEREEMEESGVLKVSMWNPRIVARAMRNPDGSPSYPRDDGTNRSWRHKAIELAEQYADGEIIRASNFVLEMSGYGDEAEKQAGKALRKTGTTSS